MLVINKLKKTPQNTDNDLGHYTRHSYEYDNSRKDKVTNSEKSMLLTHY